MVLDLVLVRAVKNIVKIKLSDHHNSCFHDRTGWISKRRLKKKKYNRSAGDYFAKAMTCCFDVLRALLQDMITASMQAS